MDADKINLINDLHDAFEKTLNKRLPLPKGSTIAQSRLTTPVNWYRQDPRRYQQHLGEQARQASRAANTGHRSELIRQLQIGLSMLEGRPERPATVSALRETYVFPPEPQEELTKFHYNLPDAIVPNASESDAIAFLNKLAQAAHNNRSYIDPENLETEAERRALPSVQQWQTLRSRFALLGDKGIGKTTYLNYLFAVNASVLHEQRVLWFRIDYTREAPVDITLEDRVMWQLLHTMFRYYERDAMDADIKRLGTHHRNCEHWLQKVAYEIVLDLSIDNPRIWELARLSNPRLTRESFEKVVTDEKIAIRIGRESKKITPWFFEVAWKHLVLDKRIALIGIIDGLDRLGITSDQTAKFAIKLKETQSVVLDPLGIPQCAYLVTMRKESYSDHLTIIFFDVVFNHV